MPTQDCVVHNSPPRSEVHPPRTPTTIDFLPAELLALIFEQCFLNFKFAEEGQPDLANPPWYFISNGLTPWLQLSSQVDKLECYRSPTRFPYALAAVSQFWMEVLSVDPEYWRQIIVYQDLDLPNYCDFSSFLSWSHDLPIDVIILRRNIDQTACCCRFNEPRYIKATMDILEPHLLRCRSLYIETHFRSSIPLIVQHIHPLTFTLSSLFLICKSCDIDWYPSIEAFAGSLQWYDPTMQFMPWLTSLVVEGKNLDNILTYPFWLSQQVNLEQLVISDQLRSNHGATLAQILEVIHRLPNLLRLKFENVEFNINTDIPSSAFATDIEDLHLEAVSPRFIRELFELLDLNAIERIHFTHCLIEDLPSCDMLILEAVKINQNFPLAEMLADWDGSYLWIGNFGEFSDDIFDMLRKFSDSTHTFDCPWLESLYLWNLPSFSLKKLKKMIKRRNRDINYDDPEWRYNTDFGPAIRTLCIQHCGVAELTAQDIEWFRSRVVGFNYVK